MQKKGDSMKICIPTETNQSLKAKVNTHFGSSPYFLIYDSNKETFQIINNSNEHHIHGMCHPLSVLENLGIDAVVCRGMGVRAVQKLNSGGIKAYRTSAETVEEIIKKYKNGILEIRIKK